MKLILIIILLISSSVKAQVELSESDINTVYNLYKMLKTNPSLYELNKNNIEIFNNNEKIYEVFNSKCGMPLNDLIINNFDKFSNSQKNDFNIWNQRPVMQRNVLTPSGKFRVHYDENGTNAINYDINLFLEAVDSSYNYIVNFLGYPAPPIDNGAGGGDEYDFYISNIGSSIYGETKIENEISQGSKKFTSYILINNNFNGFYTQGIDAARVTVAHELLHAIQLGNYINRYSQDAYFYEISSTAMEEFVYNSINDYYPYMRSFFNNPTRSFNNTAGYDFAIWNIFLDKKYGHEILKRQWELMPEMRAISAINKSITEKGSSFKDEFNTFGIWTYFTGHRADNLKYFDEGNMYPLIKNLEISYMPPSKTVNMSSNFMANSYLRFSHRTSTINDSLITIITNGQWENLLTNSLGSTSFVYELFSNETSGSVKLTDNYYSKLTVDNILLWTGSEILNDEVVKDGITQSGNDLAFPSPFYYSKHSFITIPVKAVRGATLNFSVFNSSMMLVYSSTEVFDKKLIWYGKDNNNNKLPSGVYIFAVENNQNVNKGKLVIFNE